MSEYNNGSFPQDDGFQYGSFNHSDTFNNTFNNTQSNDEETVKIVPTSFYTPFIYTAILLISLVYFSKYYKNQKLKKLTQLKSIFDENDARDLYFQLKSMNQDETTTKIHEKVLKAALLNRGAENIRRSFKLKELTPQVETLYKNGSIGEDYWESFQTEIKIIEAEVKDCIIEAERLQPGWPKLFLGLCQEICFNQALQRRYNSILERKMTCIKEWDLNVDKDGHIIQD